MSKQDWKDTLVSSAWAYGAVMAFYFTGVPTLLSHMFK